MSNFSKSCPLIIVASLTLLISACNSEKKGGTTKTAKPKTTMAAPEQAATQEAAAPSEIQTPVAPATTERMKVPEIPNRGQFIVYGIENYALDTNDSDTSVKCLLDSHLDRDGNPIDTLDDITVYFLTDKNPKPATIRIPFTTILENKYVEVKLQPFLYETISPIHLVALDQTTLYLTNWLKFKFNINWTAKIKDANNSQKEVTFDVNQFEGCSLYVNRKSNHLKGYLNCINKDQFKKDADASHNVTAQFLCKIEAVFSKHKKILNNN